MKILIPILVLGVLAIAVISYYFLSPTSDEVAEAIEAPVETTESVSVEGPSVSVEDRNPNTINLRVVNKTVSLGDTIKVTWDTSKVPNNAHGMGLHIVRPDHDFVSATGVVGINPYAGEAELQPLPETPFYGFVENGDYYIAAHITDTVSPNGNTLMYVDGDFFKITSKQ